MTPEELERLSVAELIELIVQLQSTNQQIRDNIAALHQISVEMQQIFEPNTAADSAQSLILMSQSLMLSHSYEDLAGLLHERTVQLFAADYGVLFIRNDAGVQTPILPPDQLAQLDAEGWIGPAGDAAAQAFETETVIIADEAPGHTCIAVPLVRHGTCLGAFVLLTSVQWGSGMPPSDWAALTVFSGMVALACANIEHTRLLNNQTRLLEALVTQRSRQMQLSRNVLRVIVDNLPEGVLLWDASDRICAVNRAFASGILGAEPREVVGQRYAAIQDRLIERTTAALQEAGMAEDKLAQSGTPGMSRKHVADPFGSLHWYEVRRIEIAGDDPETTMMLETWRVLREDER